MREIKFRAFDSKMEQPMWDTEGCLSLIMLQNRVANGDADDKGMLDRFKFMQFTGLFDKEGREIYEGDIVRSGMTGANYLIFWHDENASFRKQCVNANKKDIDIWQDNSSVRVIGNIHETPDLCE
jgi:uncharacterized phage protein (TIGR01671 family)